MNNVYVYYHVPKCGGTFFWHQALLYSAKQNLNTEYETQTTKINFDNNFIEAILYSNQTDESLDHITFEQNVDQKTSIPYAFKITSRCTFLASKKYIDNFLSEHGLNPIYITLLRDPISRIQSLFYYNRDFGEWEKNYKSIKEETFHDYIHTDNLESNWVVSHINNKLNRYPNNNDTQKAINILESFDVIGILEDYSLFKQDTEEYSIVHNHRKAEQNKNTKSIKLPISTADLNHLAKKCKYDINLYQHFKNKG